MKERGDTWRLMGLRGWVGELDTYLSMKTLYQYVYTVFTILKKSLTVKKGKPHGQVGFLLLVSAGQRS